MKQQILALTLIGAFACAPVTSLTAGPGLYSSLSACGKTAHHCMKSIGNGCNALVYGAMSGLRQSKDIVVDLAPVVKNSCMGLGRLGSGVWGFGAATVPSIKTYIEKHPFVTIAALGGAGWYAWKKLNKTSSKKTNNGNNITVNNYIK